MNSRSHLDARKKPPESIKATYKSCSQLKDVDVVSHTGVLDTARMEHYPHLVRSTTVLDLPGSLRDVFASFLSQTGGSEAEESSIPVYEVNTVPGLYVYPSLLPPDVQLSLLDKLFRRDLCNTEHKTNVHLHYHVPYPEHEDKDHSPSYFDDSSSSLIFEPRDPSMHKAITTTQYLNKKLRWMTLGGQYDWTNKVYPVEPPPPFPPDLKQLIEDIFPMKAEAAIVNLYSPGDTLSLHRDVSEECDQPLVSISLGCDGIFIAGLENQSGDGESRTIALRLRSGDAVLMSGESRYAWHGVPKVLEGTCPEWMRRWPYQGADGYADSRYADWDGWMDGKRVNLNVRQMFA